MLDNVASLVQSSVIWVVQKKNDMDVWENCPTLSSRDKSVAESNMRYVCASVISVMARHRLIRRVTFDFLEDIDGYGS